MQTFKMETSKPSFKLKSLPSPRDPKQLQEMLLQPSLGSAATRTLPFSDTQSSTSKARSYSVSEAMNSSSIDSLASSAAYASLASGLVMAVDDFPSYNPCVTSRVASSSGSSVSHPSSPYPLSSNLYPNYQHKSSNSNLISHSDWNGEVHQPPVNNAHASKLNSNFLRLNLNHDSTDEPILQGAIHYYSPSEELAVSNLCHLKQPVLRSRAPSISEAYRYSRPQQPTFEHQGGTQAVRSVGSRASEFREIDHSFLPGMEVVFWTVEEFEVSQNLSGRSRSGSLQERTSPSYTRRRTGTVQKVSAILEL